MGFKILSGTYTAGYDLGPRVTLLSITASGLVQGSGVSSNHKAVVVNAGIVEDAAAGLGLAGYAGVDLAVGGRVSNSNIIAAGAGGAGGGATVDGGAGGAGVLLGGTGEVTNKGSVFGGVGGVGATGNATQQGGEGGVGGAGLLAASGATVANSGLLTGGTGGAGGYNSQGALGNGGAGGDGVSLVGSGAVTNSGTIAGGIGGAGGYFRNYPYYPVSGGAGRGGNGVDASGALKLVNTGVIRGGSGNSAPPSYSGEGGYGVLAETGAILNEGLIAGGNGVGGYERGGAGARLLDGGSIANLGTIQGGRGGRFGGQGADGVDAAGGSKEVTFSNKGLIQGGAGAGGEPSTFFYGPGDGGAGGVGASLFSATAANSGTIIGGAGGYGGGGYIGAYGGVGGAGVVDNADLTNTGLIVGGAGGRGGSGNYYGLNGAAGGAGVVLGGALVNGGTIVGGAGGAGGGGFGNYGVAGPQGDGVSLPNVANLTNTAGGLISGGIGVEVGARRATVVNAGTIAGQTDAVLFHSAGDVLVLESAATFEGAVVGGNGTLELNGGAGTLTNIGAGARLSGSIAASVSGFGTYEIASGRWSISGVNALAAHASLVADTAVRVTGAFSAGVGAYVDSNARLVFAGVTGSFAGEVGGRGDVTFLGGTQTFVGATYNGQFLFGGHVLLDHDKASLQGFIFSEGLTVNTANLEVGAGGVTLVGGVVTLTDSSANRISGAAPGDAFTNDYAVISGAGQLGGGSMQLVNEAHGVIDGTGANALIIDTGAASIVNAGLIEASGAGGVVIASAVSGAGRLEANGGTLSANGAVAASQSGVIAGGALAFGASFAGAVSFTGSSGVLRLAQSQGYTGSITGFAVGGGDKLDLADIGFVSPSEASFSGTASQGVLTVTDGTNTAKITLIGDYLGDAFTAASDGHGGTVITAGAALEARAPSPALAEIHAEGVRAPFAAAQGFAATAAGLRGGGASPVAAPAPAVTHLTRLACPIA